LFVCVCGHNKKVGAYKLEERREIQKKIDWEMEME
jgi:hypothetical protein